MLDETPLDGDQTRGERWTSLAGAPVITELLFSRDSRFFAGGILAGKAMEYVVAAVENRCPRTCAPNIVSTCRGGVLMNLAHERL